MNLYIIESWYRDPLLSDLRLRITNSLPLSALSIESLELLPGEILEGIKGKFGSIKATTKDSHGHAFLRYEASYDEQWSIEKDSCYSTNTVHIRMREDDAKLFYSSMRNLLDALDN